jgi:drug/metabolite transporter (DMT)-like permease
MVWIKESSNKTIIITSISALLVIFLYGMIKSRNELFDIDTDVLLKMLISGACYGIGLILYIESVKYNHIDILNLHTIIIFILSFIISFIFLNTKMNKPKILGILIIIIGIYIISKYK